MKFNLMCFQTILWKTEFAKAIPKQSNTEPPVGTNINLQVQV